MAVCIRNIGQVGRNAILIFMMCILAGCAKDFSNTTEMSMKYKKEFILDEKTEEAETNVYNVMACQAPTGETYPQIVLKDNKDIVCGADFLNNLLKNTYCSEYQIFYADDNVLSVCFWHDTENGRIPEILTLNFQCINYRAFSNGSSVLLFVQDDNDYSDAPWPGNGIVISFDKLLQEFEQGNYYLDEEAYTFRQSQPLLFMESVQRQFQEIEERGFLEAYYARFFGKGSVGAYRMYLKEGRVGFFVSSAERWDALEAGTASYETMPYDFRIEIAYDWKADTPMYQVPYEVYRKEWENGEFSYLQVNGTGESEEKLNAAVLEDLLENLQYLDVEKTNSIMRDYRDTAYWRELPKIGPPRVTWQSERYLCIRQEPLLNEAEVLRFAEEWKRYHVYDLETGESLKLGDIINLNQSFVKWLREEKKVEAWTEYHEGGTHGELGEIFDAILEAYSEEQLLSMLEDAEFWLKEEAIYFRLPFLNEYGKPLYSYGGTGWPDYLVYAECRISKDDLKGFLTEYHAAEDMAQDMPQIKHIIIGTNYHIALCEDGTVWSWGSNDGGKLGIAESTVLRPQRIAELEDIIKIVDGGENIFALTESGEVYFWGRGSEAVWKEQVNGDNIIHTPLRLEELSGIVDIDAKNNVMFALDESGSLYSLGLYLYDYPEHERGDLLMLFSGREELGRDIAGIVAGAGFYHYFIRTDGTIFSVMDYENDGYPLYAFIFPTAGSSELEQAETYYRPEELENIDILNEQRKEGYLVYYDLPGVDEIKAAGSDMYTLFVSRTDGTLWYWNSDRIKYHDNAFALIDPESAEESTAGSFVQVDIREILGIGDDTHLPYIVDIQSGMENTVFLTSDGNVFISRYETYGVEDVSYFDRNNANPQNQSSVRQIKDMELKTLVFEKLDLTEIVSISSDGKGNFAAVDTNGVYFRIAEENMSNHIEV